MQGSAIQGSIDGGREKDQGHALAGLDLQVTRGKARRSSLRHVVQINQNRDGALATIRGKPATILFFHIKGIVMLCLYNSLCFVVGM
jgi:hypothetical protein